VGINQVLGRNRLSLPAPRPCRKIQTSVADTAFTLDCELPSAEAEGLAMEHSKTQSALEAAVMMHPLDSADALTIDPD
jgi:hypothetical protein